MDSINIDGVEYKLSDLSDGAKKQLANLHFVTQQIMQLNNELQVSETAKIGYSRALKRELETVDR